MFFGLISGAIFGGGLFAAIINKASFIFTSLLNLFVEFIYENIEAILDLIFPIDEDSNSEEGIDSSKPLLLTVIPEEVKEPETVEINEVNSENIFYDDFRFLPAYKAELFLEDLKAHFKKYKMDPDFAHFSFCVNPPKGSRDSQRVDSFYKKNKNALPEFLNLLAAYPEIGRYALSDLVSKERIEMAKWFESKLFTFSDKGKRIYA